MYYFLFLKSIAFISFFYCQVKSSLICFFLLTSVFSEIVSAFSEIVTRYSYNLVAPLP